MNLSNIIKEKEMIIQKEIESKYIDKIKELEKRSDYLDRSLELIEEMKYKFQHFENQQN